MQHVYLLKMDFHPDEIKILKILEGKQNIKKFQKEQI